MIILRNYIYQTMKVTDQLSSASNHRDEGPIRLLAGSIAKAGHRDAVIELVVLLDYKDKAIRCDSIKVLFEIGKVKPAILSQYTDRLAALLNTRENNLQWGAMIAFDNICDSVPAKIYKALPAIVNAADNGFVITNDHCVDILMKLTAIKNYRENIIPLLLERILRNPVNHLTTYSEKARHFMTGVDKESLLQILQSRLSENIPDTKRKRLEKAIHKLNKI